MNCRDANFSIPLTIVAPQRVSVPQVEVRITPCTPLSKAPYQSAPQKAGFGHCSGVAYRRIEVIMQFPDLAFLPTA